ncbi:hypothetical protein [Microbacterium trichothecenolyticum]|uniref:Uncharacterized protein n=1 Tax=Microbacterium trichothecenolyticum TaxID=69370 RepID=A0ABU0TYP6_MICTR|nr:hypothetical protein [Microbacterium trichothecenolyticum]MDQ1124783.1 hypothetical protein [Microbacterium trichothecenolyticum]
MNTPADRLPRADAENIVPDSEGLSADVPAGAAGADTGAVDAAEIDADDEARLQNISSQNDLPGVGTRAADGLTERGTDDARGEGGSTSRHTEDAGGADTDREAAHEASATRVDAEPHVDGNDPIAAFQPGVGRDSAASSRIAQNLPDPDDA